MKNVTLHQLFTEHPHISTDTRILQKGGLFFALKGENFNGNAFAKKALQDGAAYAIIDEAQYNTSPQTILVDNVLEALQSLANHHRKSLNIPIIALTGSNGKTTTKELINAVLSQKFNTTATQGNLNNHIGVPLTLLSIHKDTEIAIVEMGANHFGEIDTLCQIAEPDYGYITNFGKAHLEGFGDLNGVVKAKTELYRHLIKNQKTIFINADDATQVEHSKNANTFTLGQNKTSDLNVTFIEASPYVKVRAKGVDITSNLIGKYNFGNIAAAIAMGIYFNVPIEKIKNGIESYTPANNRSQILQKDNHTILMDAYNANPTSMKAALENFAQLQAPHKTVILGDMFEVGAQSEFEHQAIVEFIEKDKFDRVYLVGENFSKTKVISKNISQHHTFDDFKNHFKPVSKSYILIKGSRGMALERTLELL